MASDDAQTRRAVEQVKLDRWCADHHIEAASDLAFYFLTYEEALLEGRAAADGWEQARREVEIGAGALVRDLFRREQVSQAALRPTISPTLTSRPAHADRFVEFTANFEVRLKGILQQAEVATVKRALHTWQELQVVLTSSGVTQPDKLLLATFIRQHAAPIRAFWFRMERATLLRHVGSFASRKSWATTSTRSARTPDRRFADGIGLGLVLQQPNLWTRHLSSSVFCALV